MKARFLALALFGSLMLTFGFVAAACGDDGGGGALTLGEFFQRVQELDDEFESRTDELDSQFNELDEGSSVDDAVDLLEQQVALVEEFIDGLADLEPPDEAADLHAEAVDAGRDVEDAFNGLLDQAQDAGSIDELFGTFESGEFDEVFARFEQVCLDAEQLAADNGITVDFDCEEVE